MIVKHIFSAVRILLLLLCAVYLAILTGFLLLRFLFGGQLWWLSLINNFRPWFFLPLLVVLPLVTLLRSRWLLIPSAILAVIGVGLFGPAYLPKNHPTPSGPTIKIVTF